MDPAIPDARGPSIGQNGGLAGQVPAPTLEPPFMTESTTSSTISRADTDFVDPGAIGLEDTARFLNRDIHGSAMCVAPKNTDTREKSSAVRGT